MSSVHVEGVDAQQQQQQSPAAAQQPPQPLTQTAAAAAAPTPKAAAPCTPPSGVFIPLATWADQARRPARTSPSDSEGTGEGPGPVCNPEGLAVLHNAQGRCPRILFLGESGGSVPSPGAGGNTEEALHALLGPSAALPPPDAPVLWIWSRLEPLPISSATLSSGALATSIPDPEAIFLYLSLPPPPLRAPPKVSGPGRAAGASVPSPAPNPGMSPTAGRALLAAALLVTSCVAIVETTPAPASSSSSSSSSLNASVRIQQVSMGMADLNISLGSQPLQLVVLIPLPFPKYTLLQAAQQESSGHPASSSSSSSQHMGTLTGSSAQLAGGTGGGTQTLAAFEQQQLDQLPEPLIHTLQRQLDLHFAPVPSTAAAAGPSSLARQTTLAATKQGGPSPLRTSVQGSLARVLCSGPSRGYSVGGASCQSVRGPWLGRLVQVFSAHIRARMGPPTLAECRAEAEAFKALDAEEEALAEHRKRMTPIDFEALKSQHAEAVASACRVFMNLVIEVRNVHSIADSFRALKSKCDEQCARLVTQAESERNARHNRLRSGRSGNLPGSRHGRRDSVETSAAKAAMSLGQEAGDAAGTGTGAGSPFKVHIAVDIPGSSTSQEHESPSAAAAIFGSPAKRVSLHLNTLYAQDEWSEGGAAAAKGNHDQHLVSCLSSPLNRISLPLIDRTRLSRGTVQAIHGHVCDASCGSAGCPAGYSSLPGSPKFAPRHSAAMFSPSAERSSGSRSRSSCGLPPVGGRMDPESSDHHFDPMDSGGSVHGGSRLGPSRGPSRRGSIASVALNPNEVGAAAAIVANARAEAHFAKASSSGYTYRDSGSPTANSPTASPSPSDRASGPGLAGQLGDKLQGLMQNWGVADSGASVKGSVLARILVRKSDTQLSNAA